jgi:hypothetical protein
VAEGFGAGALSAGETPCSCVGLFIFVIFLFFAFFGCGDGKQIVFRPECRGRVD